MVLAFLSICLGSEPTTAALDRGTSADTFAGIWSEEPEPRVIRWTESGRPMTLSIGTAKPADPLAPVIMPMRAPARSTSAPPLEPGAMGALNCIRRKPEPATGTSSAGRMAEMIPCVAARVGDRIDRVTLGKTGSTSWNQRRERTGRDLERSYVTSLIGTEEFNVIKNLSIRHTDLDFSCALDGME